MYYIILIGAILILGYIFFHGFITNISDGTAKYKMSKHDLRLLIMKVEDSRSNWAVIVFIETIAIIILICLHFNW